MKEFSTAITTSLAAAESGWVELVDIYLRAAILTPLGTVSTLRLTTCPSGFAFFTPLLHPEPVGTQGAAAQYGFWPLKHNPTKNSTRFADNKMTLAASNVSGEWATMLDAVDWSDTYVVIRSVCTTIPSPAAEDCAILFIGQVDSCSISEEQLQLTCSSSLGNFSTTLPAEDMHAVCRFRWADDQCTAIRHMLSNQRRMTCGAGCTTGRIVTAAQAWLDEPVTLNTDTGKVLLDAHGLSNGDMVKFGGTLPASLVAGQWYWVVVADVDDFKVSEVLGGDPIGFPTAGSDVTLTSEEGLNETGAEGDYGTDLVNGLADGAITASSYGDFGMEQYRVKSSYDAAEYWSMDPGDYTVDNGYWTLPDAQAGLANAALKPWIQFDFGSAKTIRCWRIKTRDNVERDHLPRLIVLFSSSDASTWTHEGYFEMQPSAGTTFDVLLHNAASARYWRICMRTSWSDTIPWSVFNKVFAYEGGRNFWAQGRISFLATTATEALRGVSVPVLSSFAGGLDCRVLPVAPAEGDRFVVSRGCPRTFNGCCERGNWENFGGFDSLPQEVIVR